MAFPSTPILDNFDRADGAIGANWGVSSTGTALPTILSNVAIAAASAYGAAIWEASTFLPDQECYITIPTGSTSFSEVGLQARVTNQNTASKNYYLLRAEETSGGNGGIWISRGYGGTDSGTLAKYNTNLTFGDSLGLQVLTSGANYLVKSWIKRGSANWTQLATYTEVGGVATYPNLNVTSYIGFANYGSATTSRSIDNFGGGYATGGVSNVDLTSFPKTSMRKRVQPR